jgi:hypothetical protein
MLLETQRAEGERKSLLARQGSRNDHRPARPQQSRFQGDQEPDLPALGRTEKVTSAATGSLTAKRVETGQLGTAVKQIETSLPAV